MKTDVFQWKNEYSVGLKKVDEQHQEFLRIINNLGDCIANKSYDEKRTEIFMSLVNFSHRYLLDEKIMANVIPELDYSFFRAKHKEFSSKLDGFQKDCQNDCSENLFIKMYNYLKRTYPEYLSHYTPTLVKILKESGVE